MATFNAIIKKRNTDNTDWDNILPITTADNVLMNEQGETVSDLIAAKADKTEIPTSLPASGGDADTVTGFTVGTNVPANAKFTDTTYGAATITVPGLMSAADKIKLNGIATGANNYTLPDTLPIATKATNGTDYGTSRLRNIYAGTADLTPGVSALASGSIYIVYE